MSERLLVYSSSVLIENAQPEKARVETAPVIEEKREQV